MNSSKKTAAKKTAGKTPSQTDKIENHGQLEQNGHFGVPVYSIMVREFDQHQQALIDYMMKLREQDKGVMRSNVRGWHSNEDLFMQDNPHTQWMCTKIQNIARIAAKHFHGEQRPGYPELSACWGNISDSGAWNAPHQHLPADWSGVFYLDAEIDQPEQPKGAIREGDLMFFNPLPMGRRFDRPTTISYQPINGKLLIFPAYATHMVAPHFSEKPRISVSFNLFWRNPKQLKPEISAS